MKLRILFNESLKYFVLKIVLTYKRKNCSSDRVKPLKFEAEYSQIFFDH